MTAQEWLRKASASLESAGIADAESDAWLMFSHVTGMSRMEYTLDRDKCLSDEEICSLAKMLEKRNQHIPVQQITGEAWFMGYPFFVNENVLIPRMDTEVLVEAVLTRLPAVPVTENGKRRVLDMCTGSGCILLSLLKEEKGLLGTGADISEKALLVARENAHRLECEAQFIFSDLWENIEDTYEIIVSNPPYILRNVISTLDTELKDHAVYLNPYFTEGDSYDAEKASKVLSGEAGEAAAVSGSTEPLLAPALGAEPDDDILDLLKYCEAKLEN